MMVPTWMNIYYWFECFESQDDFIFRFNRSNYRLDIEHFLYFGLDLNELVCYFEVDMIGLMQIGDGQFGCLIIR